MKLTIEKIGVESEEEIVIKCHEVNDEVLEWINRFKTKTDVLLGYSGEGIYRIQPKDIYYFESVDNKVFIYCKDKDYESKQKLYELEELYGGKRFFRASKSVILNLTKISCVIPSISGRFEAKLENGETVVISRQYVPVVKQMLGI